MDTDSSSTKRSSSPGPSSTQPSRKCRRRCLSEAAREKKRRKRMARISIPVDPKVSIIMFVLVTVGVKVSAVDVL